MTPKDEVRKAISSLLQKNHPNAVFGKTTIADEMLANPGKYPNCAKMNKSRRSLVICEYCNRRYKNVSVKAWDFSIQMAVVL